LRDLVLDPELVSLLPPASLRPLNTFRDTAYLLTTIPNLLGYRTAHRFLSLYLKRRGLYSAKFGHLGGIHLSLMLSRVVKLLVYQTKNQKVFEQTDVEHGDHISVPSPATIIRSFFAYYAVFDWANGIVSDPDIATSSNRASRSIREPVYIQSIFTPTARLNVASSCTRLSAQTFASEFALANDKLAARDWSWCFRSKQQCSSDFLSDSGAYARITIDVWDVDALGRDKVREMTGSLESRITGLMVGLGNIEGLRGRVWPSRFREKQTTGDDDDDQLRGQYLVGISAKDDWGADRKKIMTGKVVNAVQSFERTIKGMKTYDQRHMWIEVDVVPRLKISEMGLVLDERDWGAI
jgi:poly(A) polymerase Pap1